MSTGETFAEWFAALKVGDEVAVSRGLGMGPPQIERVERTFPSGAWVIVSGQKFKSNGGRVNGSAWDRLRLSPVTPEVRAKVQRARLISVLERQRWDDFSTEALETIARAVAAAKTKPEATNG